MKEPIVSLQSLLSASNGSVYKLAILLAKRAFQLADGDKSCIDIKPGEKPLTIAMKEILAGKVRVATKKEQSS